MNILTVEIVLKFQALLNKIREQEDDAIAQKKTYWFFFTTYIIEGDYIIVLSGHLWSNISLNFYIFLKTDKKVTEYLENFKDSNISTIIDGYRVIFAHLNLDNLIREKLTFQRIRNNVKQKYLEGRRV